MLCENDLFLLPKALIPSLVTMEKLCALYNHPERSFPTIHVAGTNGKGSVCTKIAACLERHGYKVGLYTSPHITTFRERIQINGQMISEEELKTYLNQIHTQAAFFEIATLLAFLYFRDQKVDFAVIETGLGGRWDATNVITPLLSVITSIGYDHIDLLGPTLEDIAWEKAGIIKKGVPVVIGPDVPVSLMQAEGSPLYRSSFQSDDYDEENQEIARLALNVLQVKSFEGLSTKPPCRFERRFHKKEIILDVAHNAHGFAKLLQNLTSVYPNHNYRFIVGFSKGKDISECARLLEKQAHAVHLVSASHPRLATLDEISSSFLRPLIEKSIPAAIQHALEAPGHEIVVIAGSFFIMDEARRHIEQQRCSNGCF